MLTLITVFFTSFLVALSGAMMPGPLLTATVSESSRRGFVAGPLLILGHGILEFTLVIALMLGLSPFLKREGVAIAIGLVGGAFLLWMAAGMIRSLPSLTLKLEKAPSRGGRLVATGVLLSLANPYWVVWWATIGLGYIVYAMKLGLAGILVFYTGHILADLAWYSLVSFSIERGRRYFTDGLYRGVIGLCSGFLLFFGGWFIYDAVGRLLH